MCGTSFNDIEKFPRTISIAIAHIAIFIKKKKHKFENSIFPFSIIISATSYIAVIMLEV